MSGRRSITQFKWTDKRSKAALALAEGCSVAESARRAGCTEAAIWGWQKLTPFMEEVDRLTFMTGLALKAERVRIVKRLLLARMNEEGVLSSAKDSLDWIKLLQGETDGQQLNLTSLFEALTGLAGGRQTTIIEGTASEASEPVQEYLGSPDVD